MRKKIFITIVGFALLANVEAQIKVNSAGEVTIGATNPGAKLFIDGSMGFYQPNSKISGIIWKNPSYQKNSAAILPVDFGDHARQGLGFYTGDFANNTTDAVERMRITRSGNVGIGITNPSELLHVYGGALKIGNTSNATDRAVNVLKIGDGNFVQIGEWEEDDLLSFRAKKYNFTTTGFGYGYVGIDRSNPSYKLDVNGTIRANSTLYSSDERLKTEIKPLTDEKDRLYLLQGKSYKKMLLPEKSEEFLFEQEEADEEISLEKKEAIKEFFAKREERTESPEYGYLAQELKEIFPDLVDQDSEGYYSVNYIGLIPIIVEALKDQKLTIENLQKEIQEITAYPEESKMDELLQRVESLERALAMCCNTNQLRSTETSFQQFELTNPADSNQEAMILYQNAPNPFNENTTIQCYIPQTVKKVQLCVYDMQGVQQKCLPISERGTVVVQIQARQLAAGIYTYLSIGDDKASEAKQMILTR